MSKALKIVCDTLITFIKIASWVLFPTPYLLESFD